MTSVSLSVRWFRLLLWLYPADFRDEMGDAIVAAYHERAIEARRRRGLGGVVIVCARAFFDAIVNGPAEHLRPATLWRRAGNWSRDVDNGAPPPGAPATLRRRHRGHAHDRPRRVRRGVYGRRQDSDRPLPYRAPEQLYWVWRDQSAASGPPRDWLSGPDADELQRAGGAIEAVAGMQLFGPTLSATRDGEPMQIRLLTTTPNLFDVLGVKPALGRTFTAQEVNVDRVVLSHATWTRLGADPRARRPRRLDERFAVHRDRRHAGGLSVRPPFHRRRAA